MDGFGRMRGHTQRMTPKREQKIGTRSDAGMNTQDMMLPSQLTWFTVMPNSDAAKGDEFEGQDKIPKIPCVAIGPNQAHGMPVMKPRITWAVMRSAPKNAREAHEAEQAREPPLVQPVLHRSNGLVEQFCRSTELTRHRRWHVCLKRPAIAQPRVYDRSTTGGYGGLSVCGTEPAQPRLVRSVRSWPGRKSGPARPRLSFSVA